LIDQRLRHLSDSCAPLSSPNAFPTHRYQNTGAADKNQNQDAACVMCQAAGTTGVYVQWGRQSCTNGHRTEYNGLVMANHHTYQKSEYICVDYERAAHATSDAADLNGALLYTTEMERGSSDEAQYPHDREVGCAVCSIEIVTYDPAAGLSGRCQSTPIASGADWALTGGANLNSAGFGSAEYAPRLSPIEPSGSGGPPTNRSSQQMSSRA
jgi:hypothetical protein